MTDTAEEFQLEPLTQGPAYIRPRLKELTALAQRKVDASESFKVATDAVAEKANISPGALRAYVMAQVDEDPSKKVEKKSTESSDFCMLADELQ